MSSTVRAMRLTFAAAALLVPALSACGGGDASEGAEAAEQPRVMTVRGTVSVPIDLVALWDEGMEMGRNETYERGSTPCQGDRDLVPSIKPGAQVIVRDADGTTVGVAELAEGLLGGQGNQAPMNSPCTFAFEAPDVPVGESFYSFQVGQEAEVTLSAAEVEQPVLLRLR